MHKAYLGVGRWLWLAGLVIVLDQLTKLGFDAQLKYGERIHLLPFFDFTLLYNPGAAFSFLADEAGWQRWFFTLLALGASIFIIWMMHKNRSHHRMMLALALILGGAIGNVIDRIWHGYVIDFISTQFGTYYFPIFNFADICVSIGTGLVILSSFVERSHHE